MIVIGSDAIRLRPVRAAAAAAAARAAAASGHAT
jgi:hypothetical protein